MGESCGPQSLAEELTLFRHLTAAEGGAEFSTLMKHASAQY